MKILSFNDLHNYGGGYVEALFEFHQDVLVAILLHSTLGDSG